MINMNIKNEISRILGSYYYVPIINILEDKIKKLQKDLKLIQKVNRDILKKIINVNPKEEEWNSKYPKVNRFYLRHETDGDYQIDVRNFFMPYDSSIPTVKGKDDNEKALNALLWVMKNIKYTPDKTEYKYSEYWAYPYQTLKRKRGIAKMVQFY